MPIDIRRINSGQNNLNGNQPSIDTGRTEEVSRTQGTSSSSVNYGALKEGQVFSGQVTNITPDRVTIELKGGETLEARYDSKSELVIGDGARFKVISNDNGTIVLKAMNSSSSIDSAVLKALEANDMPYTERNEELISSLLKNEFPVNKQMVNKILTQSLMNPDISLKNLVTMNKLGLPIEPETTRMFENYSNANGDITPVVKDTFNDMLSMIDGLLSDGYTDEASAFAGQTLDILNIGEGGSTDFLNILEDGSVISEGEITTPDNLREFLSEVFSKEEAGEEALLFLRDNVTGENEGRLEEKPALKEGEANSANVLSTGEENAGIPITGDTRLAKVFTDAERLEIFSLFENSDNADAGELQKLLKGSISMEDFTELLKTLPDEAKKSELPETLKNFAKNVSTSFTENENLREIMPKEATLAGEADALSNLLKSGKLTKDQISGVLHSKDFTRTLKALLYSDWTLAPEELNKNAIKELYDRVQRQSLAIETAAGKAVASGLLDNNALKQDMGNMNQNLNFMHMLNNLMTYAQLPVRMTGQTAAGDLYVYHNRHRGRQNLSEGVSCLLHLDLSHLGAMNVRIEMKGVNVTSKFYLDDKESADLIASHLHELDEIISKHGFVASSSVVKKNDRNDVFAREGGQADFIKDFVEREMPEGRFTRYTFDMRA